MSGSLRLTLHDEPGEVRRARRELTRFLEDHHVASELVERCLLVASELVTNALEASPCGPNELTAVVGDSIVTIAVENACEVDPGTIASVAMPSPQAERGRGLPLVAATVARLSITCGSGRFRVGADLVARS